MHPIMNYISSIFITTLLQDKIVYFELLCLVTPFNLFGLHWSEPLYDASLFISFVP
jgi:hypothetical protein